MNKPYVVESEDFIAIVGTNDRKVAEVALREAEVEWYGENQEEAQLDIEKFSLADIYFGEHKGEEMHYWGNDPQIFFDGGKYETIEGFIGTWEDTLTPTKETGISDNK